MLSLSPKGLQYGPREILLLFIAISLLIGGSVYLSEGDWNRYTMEFYLFAFPLFVGVLFYIISCSMRYRTPECGLKRSTAVISILILIITGILLFCVLWAEFRIRDPDFYNQPSQKWFHPDKVILLLNQYYDGKFPASPGTMKLHEEFPRVEWTIIILIAPLVGIIGWRLGMLLPFKRMYILSFFGMIKRLFHPNK